VIFAEEEIIVIVIHIMRLWRFYSENISKIDETSISLFMQRI